MIPTWLQRHLEQAGRWNADGISRRLAGGHCRRCGAPVVRGLDDDVAGLPVTCDPHPVSRVGEVVALAAGRRTVNLHCFAGRWLIADRSPAHIRSSTAYDVLAEHACHSPPLPLGEPLHVPTPTRPADDRCPF